MQTNATSKSRLIVSLATLLFALCATGCSSVAPQKVADFNNPEGVPYYGGNYYLLIYPDGKGNAAWTLEYAMDPNKKMEYRSTNFLSKTTATLTFSNGLLTKGVTTSDSTAIVQTLTTAVSTVAQSLFNLSAGNHTVGAPMVFKLLPSNEGIEFVGQGENGDVRIKAPITSASDDSGEEG